jgi:hypothetical protein
MGAFHDNCLKQPLLKARWIVQNWSVFSASKHKILLLICIFTYPLNLTHSFLAICEIVMF